MGRIRGHDFLRRKAKENECVGAKSLYPKATATAKSMGEVNWVKNNPLAAWIVLIRQEKKKRKAVTYEGNKRQAKRDKAHANRENEPWLLVASLSLQPRSPKQIMKIYQTRMQIEEGFCDCKAVRYSVIFLARLLIPLRQFQLPEKAIKDALNEIKP